MALALRLCPTLVATLLLAETALAQGPSPPPAAAVTRPAADRRAALAKALNPASFGPAFVSGAQAEIVGPELGVSSVVLGYDAVWTQIEASAGFALGGDLPHDQDDARSYALGLRIAFPVHRGVKADYALFLGGGAFVIEPRDAESHTLGTATLGTRIRVFMSPNVATVASLGGALIIDQNEYRVVIGARPLGAAGVSYFFR